MSDHAKLSPSSAHRWMRCPGSVSLTEGLPDTDSEFSREGTFGHAIAADLLENDIELARTALESTNGEFTVDAEMAEHLQVYLNVVRGLLLVGGGTLHVEKLVRLTPQVYGTADALIWEPARPRLHVVDLKLGSGIYVEAAENEQLMVYGLASLAELGLDPRHVDVALHIVQPRFTGAAPHRSWEPPRERMVEFRRELAEAELAVAKPDAPLVPGEHCHFCKAKSTCPGLRAQALVGAQGAFDDLDTPAPRLPAPADLTPAQLAMVLDRAPMVEAWLKAMRQRAFEQAARGEPVPGYKLVEKVGNRRWIDENATAAALASHGLDPWARSLISPAEVERRSKTLKPLVATLTERPVTGASLVPESDRRPPINSANIFPLLTDTETI